MTSKINQLGSLNLKYNKMKQNRPNWNDWGDNKKILIDIMKYGFLIFPKWIMESVMLLKWIIDGLMSGEVLWDS